MMCRLGRSNTRRIQRCGCVAIVERNHRGPVVSFAEPGGRIETDARPRTLGISNSKPLFQACSTCKRKGGALPNHAGDVGVGDNWWGQQRDTPQRTGCTAGCGHWACPGRRRRALHSGSESTVGENPLLNPAFCSVTNRDRADGIAVDTHELRCAAGDLQELNRVCMYLWSGGRVVCHAVSHDACPALTFLCPGSPPRGVDRTQPAPVLLLPSIASDVIVSSSRPPARQRSIHAAAQAPRACVAYKPTQAESQRGCGSHPVKQWHTSLSCESHLG